MISSEKAGVSKRLVLDASVAVSWCFEDETRYADWVLDRVASGTEVVVPALWAFEVANALLHGERRKRVTTAQVVMFLERLQSFSISVDSIPISRVFDRVFTEARQWGLTMYDASYLELAQRLGLPLATLDDPMKRAAKAMNVMIAHEA